MSTRVALRSVLPLALVLLLTACPATPPVSTTPEPDETEAAETEAAETEAAEAGDPEEYFAELCEIATVAVDEVAAIRGDVDATTLPFEERVERSRDQTPDVAEAYEEAISSLEELTPPEGADEFHEAQVEDLQTLLEANITRAEAFDEAEAEADLDAANEEFAETTRPVADARLMAVHDLPGDLREILAEQERCRALNLEARAMPAGEAPFDWEVVYSTDFEDEEIWDVFPGDPEIGQPVVEYADGEYRWEFESRSGWIINSLDVLGEVGEEEEYEDVRLEVDVVSESGNPSGGLICRNVTFDPVGQMYEARLSRNTVQLWGDGEVLAQLTTEDVDDSGPNTLALECYDSDDGVTLVAELNGERLFEYLDEVGTFSGPGWVGMVVATPGGGGVMTFDNFSVAVPSDEAGGDGDGDGEGVALSEEALLERIPPNVVESCFLKSIGDDSLTVVCDLPDGSGADVVIYTLTADLETMMRLYEITIDQWDGGVTPDSGDCPDELPSERPYDIGEEEVGRLACAVRDDGSARIAWTDSRLLILADAQRADGDMAALYEWWTGPDSGPLQ